MTFQTKKIEVRKVVEAHCSSNSDIISIESIAEEDRVLSSEAQENTDPFESSESSFELFSINPIPHHEFDKEFYLKLNPDIAAAQIDPYLHFINHGIYEGRRGSPYNFRKDVEPLSNTKETVLIVSHDASRTGAPILALNIAQILKKNFNVIVLILNDGHITPFFEQTCSSIISVDKSMIFDNLFIEDLIDHIVQKYAINSAIVNSIESFCVLKPLAKRFIPSVLLIHEFAAYTRPHYKFIEAFHWAGKIIFPAKVVQENAINIHTHNAIDLTQVLPQGKSIVPSEPGVFHSYQKVESILNMNDNKGRAKPFIVLGAGSVHYRKGVDLFIATAAELKHYYPEYNIKMLWIGSGFDPDHDISYSCYLSEQIQRSGLSDYFHFIEEIPNLEDIYPHIDLFYLSSRLDPLPNVAIDVMMLGKPIICFNKGTGIAEILEQDPDTSQCISPHLSISESAKKIVQFHQSAEYYSLISSKVKELAVKHFNMIDYVSHLLGFIRSQSKQSKQEELDCITLETSNDFKKDFFAESKSHKQDAIRRYVRSWHSKTNLHDLLRKPAPGFNPSIYDFYHRDRGDYIEPFADFIRLGKPDGPWQEKVISPKYQSGDESVLNCAIHIHVFYADLLKDILDRILKNKSNFDLYISTNDSVVNEISQFLSEYEHIHFKLNVVPNRGRDIGPLLTEFCSELQNYDVIGHFHTKKSLDISNSQFAHNWFLFLIENLIGGQHQMADQIMDEFNKDQKLGLVFADDPHLLDWGRNKPFADALANELKISNLPDYHFNFPVGTMFWARPEAIKPLWELNFCWESYPEEPIPYDGSVLHAIERLIPFIARNQGFSQVVTHIPGLTR